jgi:hypothetical protein
MVLLEIDAESISGTEFEGNALRPIHVDRVAGWGSAFQGVKVKPR